VRGARVVAIGKTAVGGNLDGLRDGRAFSVRYLRQYSISKARAVEGPGTPARELNGVQVFWHNLRPEDEDPHPPRGLLRGARWLLAPGARPEVQRPSVDGPMVLSARPHV
jgi:hypothetical protein